MAVKEGVSMCKCVQKATTINNISASHFTVTPVDVTVNVDVSKIVRNAAIAGVLIVGIIFGCTTYKKLCDWEKE